MLTGNLDKLFEIIDRLQLEKKILAEVHKVDEAKKMYFRMKSEGKIDMSLGMFLEFYENLYSI